MQRYIRKGREMVHGGYKIRNIKADLAKESGLAFSTALLIHKNLILEDHERITHYGINPNDYIWFGTIDEYNEEFGDHIIIEVKADHTPNAMSVTEKVLIKSCDQISRVRSILQGNHSWIVKVKFYNYNKDLLLDDQTIAECGLLENPTIVIKSPILVVTKGSLTNQSESVKTPINLTTQSIMRLGAYELSPLMEVLRKLIDSNYPNGSILSRILNFVHMPDEKGCEMKKQFISLISDWVKYFDKSEKHELSVTDLTSIFRQDFRGHLEDAGETIELASVDDHFQSVRRMVFSSEQFFKKYFPPYLYNAMKPALESVRSIVDTYLLTNDYSNSTGKFVDIRLVNSLNYYLEAFMNNGTTLDDIALGCQLINVLPDAIPIICDANSIINQYWSSVQYSEENKFHKLYVNPNLDKDCAVHIMSATPMTTSETKQILSRSTFSENELSKEIYLATPRYDRFYGNEEKLPSDGTLSLVTVSRPDNLRKVELLCTGGYGKIYLYENKSNGQLSVLKKLRVPENKNLEAITEVIREINIFSRLAPHRRIMQYLNYYMEGRCFFIEMEYMKGGSLRTYLNKKGPLQIIEIRNLSQQILEGLKYLHDKSIFHRDIRADNVLLDDNGNAKLTDFGLSRCFQGLLEENQTELQQSGVGTERWMAPEICRTSIFGASADIWSCGVTVIEMVTGQPPYPDLPGTVAQIRIAQTGIIEFDLPKNADLQMFIGSCLKFNPSERLTVDQLLESRFIKDLTD